MHAFVYMNHASAWLESRGARNSSNLLIILCIYLWHNDCYTPYVVMRFHNYVGISINPITTIKFVYTDCASPGATCSPTGMACKNNRSAGMNEYLHSHNAHLSRMYATDDRSASPRRLGSGPSSKADVTNHSYPCAPCGLACPKYAPHGSIHWKRTYMPHCLHAGVHCHSR